MDSFYDVPRSAPAPTRLENINIRPAVPEVSLICPPKSTTNSFEEVNDRPWLRQNSMPEQNSSKIIGIEKPLSQLRSYPKGPSLSPIVPPATLNRKQVRFESPVLQQRPSLTYEPFNTRKPEKNQQDESGSKHSWELYKKTLSKNCDIQQNPSFKDIYMANIPNRHLDLSLIDIQKTKNDNNGDVSPVEREVKQENKENELPKTYKEFLETQNKILKAQKEDQRVTDILNYKRPSLEICNETPPIFSNTLLNDEETNSNQISFCNGYNSKKLHSYSPQMTRKESVRSDNVLSTREYFKSPSYDNADFNRFKDPCKQTNNVQFNHAFAPQSFGTQQNSKESCMRKETKNNDNCEITNRDLLQIIAQQNEQLLLLQKQVALLLTRDQTNAHNKPIEAGPLLNEENAKIDNEPPRFIPEMNLTPRKKHGLSKFSVDVMTSFEVAIRPQHNKPVPINCNSPKIREITEEESTVSSSSDVNKKNVEQSLHFQEPLKVVEPCQSPEPSININMKDYDSSDEEVSASEIGATFYHNLMGQVNNILKQAQIQTREELCTQRIDNKKKFSSTKTNLTMHRVREATLKHLREMGVTIGSVEENNDIVCTSPEEQSTEYSPTEISYGVKQLLMKYLPDDHLAKVCKNPIQAKTDKACKNVQYPTPAKHDFSFASLQYMKKYNLLPSADTPQKQHKISCQKLEENNKKILDLTALKMQPKLL